MREGYLVAVLFCTTQALAVSVGLPACAEEQAASPVGQPVPLQSLDRALLAPAPSFEPTPAAEPVAAQPDLHSPVPASPEPVATPAPTVTPTPMAAPVDQPPPLAAETAAPVPPLDPAVAIIRSTLADPELRKGVDADELAALEAFYGTRTSGPLWMTEMGFSAKGQAVLFEIEKADDWGLAATAFELPPADTLPTSPEAQALAEIKLDLAVLKFARFARGGRLSPPKVSRLFDQAPPLRDPATVLAEIAAAEAPDAYLQSLHPQHEQFVRLRQALLRARERGETGGKPARDGVVIKRIIINMERWRWMPEDLGPLYVWNNSPEFMLYVVKDGKTIYADKTQVGTIGYATPVFTADMATIVFNPDWVAPPTILTENLLPSLRRRNFSILKTHKLSVSYNGAPVDATKIDWGRVNIRDYTFTQKAGPDNVLGKAKFLFPNKHVVYMHDTHAVRRKYFQAPVRAVGHECVRMEKPERFAEVLLAEDKGWTASQVRDLWDNSVNKGVSLDHKIPVHMVYFTAVVDEAGKVATFADLYGLDNKLATALFGDATGFPQPPPEAAGPPEEAAAAASAPRTATAASVDFLQRAFRSD